MFFKILQRILPKCKAPPALGRWSLKHNCSSEELVVFNANRDNCGDTLCGNQEEYKKMAPKDTKKRYADNSH